MARRALTDFDTEILQRLGNRTDLTPIQRGFFLRDAYMLVAKGFDHVQLQANVTETLAQGSSSLTPVTTDIWVPMQLRHNNEDRLIDPEDKEIIDNMELFTGPPNRFYWYGSVFYFDTLAPVATPIGIKYKKRPAMFTVNSALDEIYDQLLILKGAQIGFETARDYEQATGIARLYREYISEHGLIPAHEERKNDSRNGFRVRYR